MAKVNGFRYLQLKALPTRRSSFFSRYLTEFGKLALLLVIGVLTAVASGVAAYLYSL